MVQHAVHGRFLRTSLRRAFQDGTDRAHQQLCSLHHQPVMHITGRVIGSNGHFAPIDHIAGIDLVTHEEGGGAGASARRSSPPS